MSSGHVGDSSQVAFRCPRKAGDPVCKRGSRARCAYPGLAGSGRLFWDVKVPRAGWCQPGRWSDGTPGTATRLTHGTYAVPRTEAMTTAMMPEARPGPERLWRAMYIAESELRTLVELYRLPMTNAGTVEVRDLTPEEQAVADAWNAWRLAFHEVEDFVRTATGKLIVRDAMLNGNPTLSPQVAKMREVL